MITFSSRIFADPTTLEGAIGPCTRCNGTLYLKKPLKLNIISKRELVCTRFPVCKASPSLPMGGRLELSEKICSSCPRKLFLYRGSNDQGRLGKERFICIICGSIPVDRHDRGTPT